MFIGEYTYKIDSKKRLAIPPKFREVLKKKAIITRGFDNSLFIFSIKEWQKIAEKISSLPFVKHDNRGLARMMLSGAMEVEFDSLGRILVPDYLKEYASLQNVAVVTGVHNRIEIWDKDRWEEYKKKTVGEIGDIAERMDEFVI